MTMGADSSPLATISIEGQPQPMALAEAHPADARRQALKLDARARHVEPLVQVRIVGDQLLDLGVGPVDVLADRPTGPPSGTGRRRGRTAAGCTRARSPGCRRRARRPRRARPAGCCCRSRRPAGPCALKRSRYSTCFAMERVAAAAVPWGSLHAPLVPLLHGPALRQIAVDRIVGRGLIGQRVRVECRARAASCEHVHDVAEQADRHGLAVLLRGLEQRRAPRPSVARLRVDVAGLAGASRCGSGGIRPPAC